MNIKEALFRNYLNMYGHKRSTVPQFPALYDRRLRNSVWNGIVWTIQTICTSLRTSSWTKDVEWAKTVLSERSELTIFANAFPHLEWMLEVLGAEAVWMFMQFHEAQTFAIACYVWTQKELRHQNQSFRCPSSFLQVFSFSCHSCPFSSAQKIWIPLRSLT